MTILARLTRVLLAVVAVLLVTTGAALLWADAQLDAAAVRQAEVVLAGPRVTDLDVLADDGVRSLQVATVGAPAGIGSAVTVSVVDQPLTVGRLTADDRWVPAGVGALASGVLLLVGPILVRRLRGRRRTRASGPAAAGAVVSVLLLSGCSWAGDGVDRTAYRADRSAVAAAFPVAPVSGVLPQEVSASAATPVLDPESAAVAVVALTGLPADPYSLTTARFLTRQLFDPAVLCGTGGTSGLRELLVPELVAQVDPALDDALTRFPDCTGLDLSDMRIAAASGAVSSQLPDRQAPGRTVRVRVTAGYAVPSAGTGWALWSIEREVALGFLADQPGQAVTLELLAADAGPGTGLASLPDPAETAAWDEELTPRVDRPAPESAAAVLGALAATMAAEARQVGREVSWEGADGTPQVESWSGVLLPAAGAAQLQASTGGAEVAEIRVLDQYRQFLRVEEEGGGWRRYPTAGAPRLAEGSSTDNPFAVLDWLRHLSAAAPMACPDDVPADRCHGVEVPTSALLTPGTPGYREAVVHARRSNGMMRLLVGVADGRLSAVVVDRRLGELEGAGTRVRSRWTFSDWTGGELPAVAEPTGASGGLVR